MEKLGTQIDEKLKCAVEAGQTPLSEKMMQLLKKIGLDEVGSEMDRALGSVYGAFIGDAAGAYLEFWRGELKQEDVEYAMTMPSGGAFQVGKAQVTDDSEMAMCIVNALYQEDEKIQQKLNLDNLQIQFGNWLRSPPFDIGNTTYTALEVIKPQNIDPLISFRNTKERTKSSLSNGCLMRITPLAVWGYKLNEADLFQAVRLQTAFTHSHPFSHAACYLYCFAIQLLIQGASRKDAFLQTFKEAAERFAGYIDTKSKNPHYYLNLVMKGAIDAYPKVNISIGSLIIAFTWSFHYLYKEEFTYQDALQDILERGGDTDTNAAIMGGLLGAYYGVSKMNEHQLQSVVDFRCSTSEEKKKFNVTHKRPDYLVPGLVLTEKLPSIIKNAPSNLQIVLNGNEKRPEDFNDVLINA
ncbi:hypothetical protein FGO68_gene2973 [Halteria grandinella]|uniref:ADP-ribosylglycohydrolase n=1 Tax=Halteria grandinella TaxID=5974 RepID=A0A8J8NQ38_HALGN|nr:hypothetical protein FGO68_gene2973 [Halteria grandinella]